MNINKTETENRNSILPRFLLDKFSSIVPGVDAVTDDAIFYCQRRRTKHENSRLDVVNMKTFDLKRNI